MKSAKSAKSVHLWLATFAVLALPMYLGQAVNMKDLHDLHESSMLVTASVLSADLLQRDLYFLPKQFRLRAAVFCWGLGGFLEAASGVSDRKR